ncbi:MAG: peptide deformylase [Rickettsiales bacterium]|nr:MAG: peptide deformylase [Rickettsiales bacterium]
MRMSINAARIFTTSSSKELQFLLQKAIQVDFPIDECTKKLIDIMLEILKKKKGAGLAAPQLGIKYRIMLCSFNRSVQDITIMINPSMYRTNLEEENDWEGCFSVPLKLFKVNRWKHIVVTYFDEKGNKIHKKLEGSAARIFQHEFDHLEGKLIITKGKECMSFRNQQDYKDFFYEKVINDR